MFAVDFCRQTGDVNSEKWKKRSEATQTLRAGYNKAEPKKIRPPQTPFPGMWDGQNLISWRWSLPLPTNPVWLGSMHAISSYRGNRPTNTQTGRLQYTAPQLSFASAQCNNANAGDSAIICRLVTARPIRCHIPYWSGRPLLATISA